MIRKVKYATMKAVSLKMTTPRVEDSFYQSSTYLTIIIDKNGLEFCRNAQVSLELRENE